MDKEPKWAQGMSRSDIIRRAIALKEERDEARTVAARLTSVFVDEWDAHNWPLPWDDEATKRGAPPMANQLWDYVCTCRKCGAELNRAVGITADEMDGVAIAAALMVGSCPKGCRPTYSDCNLAFVSEWIPSTQERAEDDERG